MASNRAQANPKERKCARQRTILDKLAGGKCVSVKRPAASRACHSEFLYLNSLAFSRLYTGLKVSICHSFSRFYTCADNKIAHNRAQVYVDQTLKETSGRR